MKIKIDHLYRTRGGHLAHVFGVAPNICRAFRVRSTPHPTYEYLHGAQCTHEYEVYHDGTAFMGYDWGRSEYVRGFDLMEDITDANV